jgi:outer membrane protein assembly factor BamC
MKHRYALAFAAAMALLAGCSWFGGKKNEEFKSTARPSKPLEVPPELTAPGSDDRFVIPDPRTQTTYSSYQKKVEQGPPVATATNPAVLPKIEGAHIERAGDQRWLVVKGTPDAVWPQVHDFWIQEGWSLVREQPELGIIETDWREDRSKIPQDIVRQWVGKLIDGMYSTSTRDKYRTRLEKGLEPGTTEVYVTHRGVEEVFTTRTEDSTKWQPRPNNREYEAEMLQKIMVKLGTQEATKVASAAPGAPVAPGSPVASKSSAPVEPRNAVLEGSNLVVNDGFERAWRRVGLALDRVGFTVEDRDRSKGLYFVRYIDPDASTESKKKEGFWESLKFWKSDPKVGQPQYRIHVGDAGGGLSQVSVQNKDGAPESSSTSKRILTLLYDQLK